jgi:hypothetical protein
LEILEDLVLWPMGEKKWIVERGIPETDLVFWEESGHLLSATDWRRQYLPHRDFVLSRSIPEFSLANGVKTEGLLQCLSGIRVVYILLINKPDILPIINGRDARMGYLSRIHSV